MSLGVHQKSDQDIENIRHFYSLGWSTEKESTLAGPQTRHLFGSDRIPLDLIPGEAIKISNF